MANVIFCNFIETTVNSVDILPLSVARDKIFSQGPTSGKISINASPHELFPNYNHCH